MQAEAAARKSSPEGPTRVPLETGDPAADGRLFRRCLGQYGTGIAIITTEREGRRAAITVNSFASVSLDPPLVLWSVARTSRSHPLFTSAKRFGVNILASTQMEVSRHFSSKVEDKFADAAWSRGQYGSPLIEGCLAHFECELHAQIDGGDHTVLICLVRHASRFEGEPLLFTQGQYSVADTHPSALPSTEVGRSDPETWYDETIISQLFEAHHLISLTFDEHRRAEGVDIPLARVLACLYDTPAQDTDQLARATYLGQRDTEDAVTALLDRAMLASSTDGALSLTEAGRSLREAIRTRWQVFQQEQLLGIPEADIRATARTLAKLIGQNRTKS